MCCFYCTHNYSKSLPTCAASTVRTISDRVYQCECDVKKKNMTVKLNGVIVTKLNCSKKSYNLSITCDKGYTLKNGTKEKVEEDEVTMFKCEEGAVFNYTCEKGMSPHFRSLFVILVSIQDTFECHASSFGFLTIL